MNSRIRILASLLLACSTLVCHASEAQPPAELELSIAAEQECDDLGIDGAAPAKPCSETQASVRLLPLGEDLFMTVSEPAAESRLGAPLVNEPVISGNVYRCFRDPGFAYPVCQKIGTTNAEPTPEQQAEQLAAQQTALWVLPVRPRLDPFGSPGTELCHSTTHGASGCCRITATLENGDVIVECGER